MKEIIAVAFEEGGLYYPPDTFLGVPAVTVYEDGTAYDRVLEAKGRSPHRPSFGNFDKDQIIAVAKENAAREFRRQRGFE
jgi:hypothetical protein